ncbi:f-actin capping protein alpha [Niveomyces insectorum RCEF 264]|uniref:F-actin-capping protein subunit alpha n=1 Tax=Niveomyces insectorum RCEF 264 TaxID=1081102 RepID=A0A162MQD9_9HYPO|nr:f-actin capping protein alpha [Niveomyces insectorum RCEF 264]
MPRSQDIDIVSSFVEGAPPGELANVIADIESLTISKPALVDELAPAFRKYNEEQFTTVQLPGSGGGNSNAADDATNGLAIVSADSALGSGGRYYDPASARSFAFDHRALTASAVEDYAVTGPQAGLVQAALPALAAYVQDHYARPAYGVYPADDGTVVVLIVSNKYSPQNFWNGRWRSRYVFDPAAQTLTGTVRVDVHYYEDGNVRLLTEQPQTATVAGGSAAGAATSVAASLVKEIAALEKRYQEALNKKFTTLSEGAFKGLRRQLPVTRQKIEWDKVASYRLGQDIGGGNGGRR